MPELRTEGVYIEEKIFYSVADADEYIDFQWVGKDFLLEVTHVSVENRTSDYTRLVIGVQKSNDLIEREEEDGPLADDIYWTRSLILAPEGCFLRVKLTGCTDGDEIHAFIQGVVKKVR